jgi:hypothetical protein
MTPARFAAAILLATAWPAAPALADEAAAVQAAIRGNYAAYSSFDEARYRSTTTDDFLLLEHGELFDREGDVATMAKPGTGFRRTDHFTSPRKADGDIAYAVYTPVRRSTTTRAPRPRVAGARSWREGGLVAIPSTRVSHPAGSTT